MITAIVVAVLLGSGAAAVWVWPGDGPDNRPTDASQGPHSARSLGSSAAPAWETARGWDIKCPALRPNDVEVKSDQVLDIDGDGVKDHLVVANCFTGDGSGAESVAIFHGDDRTTLLDGRDDGLTPTDVRVDGAEDGKIRISGRAWSRHAATCCPDLTFTAIYTRDADGTWSGAPVVKADRRDARTPAAPSSGRGPQQPSNPYANRVGYGPIKIGLPIPDLFETGQIVGRFGVDAHGYGQSDIRAGGHVCYSKGVGVRSIFFGGAMATSSGIRLGSTEADLLDAYPNAKSTASGRLVSPIRDGVNYYFDVSSGRVTAIIMSTDKHRCFG